MNTLATCVREKHFTKHGGLTLPKGSYLLSDLGGFWPAAGPGARAAEPWDWSSSGTGRPGAFAFTGLLVPSASRTSFVIILTETNGGSWQEFAMEFQENKQDQNHEQENALYVTGSVRGQRDEIEALTIRRKRERTHVRSGYRIQRPAGAGGVTVHGIWMWGHLRQWMG